MLALIDRFLDRGSVRKGGSPQVDLTFCLACLFDNRQRAADTLTWRMSCVYPSILPILATSAASNVSQKTTEKLAQCTPISFASAQAILSRGLGYRDFHDIQQSAEVDGSKAPQPTQNDVRDGISTSIFAFCQATKIIGIEETLLDRLVKLLPLQELRAFQDINHGHPADSSAPTVLAPPLEEARELSGPSNETSIDHAGQPTDVGLKRRHSVPPSYLIDEKGLKVL